MTSEQTDHPTTGQELMLRTANHDLAEYRKNGAHVLAPMTIQMVPPMHRPVIVAVSIDPDPKNKEVYPQKGGGLSLSGIGWKKLADGMGIQLDSKLSGRTDDGRDGNRCEYRMVGYLKAQDGTWRKLMGTKEIRMENVIQELTDNYQLKAEEYMASDKDRGEFLKIWGTPERYVQEKVRQDALQIRKHILSRAETGALARMVKSIGIRETYTAAELARPFVFPKLVVEMDPNHPEDRAFLRTQAAGAIDMMYQPAAPRLEAPAQPLPQLSSDPLAAFPELQDDGRTIEHRAPRQEAQTTAPTQGAQATQDTPPNPDEVLRQDFKASEPKGQKEILQALIKRKGYAGRVTGDMAQWTPQQRAGFFDKLLTLKDLEPAKPAGASELPFDN